MRLITESVLKWAIEILYPSNPIKVFKLPERKLQKGYIADICVLDIDNPHVYTKDEILSKSVNSPFIGNEYYGFNILTICNGKVVYKK